MTRWTKRHLGAWLLPLALGLSDGILNALTMASGAVLHGTGDLGLGLAVRVAVVAFVTAVFTVFVAEYAQLRAQLARAEVQLNLTSSGRLASSHLGDLVTREAIVAAVIASLSSLAGAFFPLAIGAEARSHPWAALPVAVGALAALGAALGRIVGGNWLRWAATMAVCGAAVAAIGDRLRIT